MNWKQLYLSATPKEQLETTLHLLRLVEERRRWLARGRLFSDRRGSHPGAHFLNERRRLRPRLAQIITRLAFISILLLVSIATWLFVLYAPPQLAALTLGLHLVGLTAILTIKLYRLKTHLARS